MSQSLAYQQMGTEAHVQVCALFAQTMAYVAVAVARFALGACL